MLPWNSQIAILKPLFTSRKLWPNYQINAKVEENVDATIQATRTVSKENLHSSDSASYHLLVWGVRIILNPTNDIFLKSPLISINKNIGKPYAGALCDMGYPSETILKFTSRQVSFAHNVFPSCPIVYKFCTLNESIIIRIRMVSNKSACLCNDAWTWRLSYI